jgi:hypothetical protein
MSIEINFISQQLVTRSLSPIACCPYNNKQDYVQY